MSVEVGADEFCLTCMEWRACDEHGRCIVCGTIIRKNEKRDAPGYGDESSKDFEMEEE